MCTVVVSFQGHRRIGVGRTTDWDNGDNGRKTTTVGVGEVAATARDATTVRAAATVPDIKNDRLRGLGVAGRVRRPVLRWRRGGTLAATGGCHGEQWCRHRVRWHRALPPPSPTAPPPPPPLSSLSSPRPRAAAPAPPTPPPRGQDVLLPPSSSPGPVTVVIVVQTALPAGVQLHPAGVDGRQVRTRSVAAIWRTRTLHVTRSRVNRDFSLQHNLILSVWLSRIGPKLYENYFHILNIIHYNIPEFRTGVIYHTLTPR